MLVDVDVMLGDELPMDGTNTRAVAFSADNITIYAVPSSMPSNCSDTIGNQVFMLCTETVMECMVYRYVQDVRYPIILLDETTWQMCRFLRQHTHCIIDDCCFRWDDNSLHDRHKIFSYTQRLEDINEYNPNSSIAIVYIYHDAISKLAQNTLLDTTLLITYNRRAISLIGQQDGTHPVTGVLLYDGVTEDPPPMVGYGLFTTQFCVRNVSPWEFVLNNDTLECTMMYMPMEFSMYL